MTNPNTAPSADSDGGANKQDRQLVNQGRDEGMRAAFLAMQEAQTGGGEAVAPEAKADRAVFEQWYDAQPDGKLSPWDVWQSAIQHAIKSGHACTFALDNGGNLYRRYKEPQCAPPAPPAPPDRAQRSGVSADPLPLTDTYVQPVPDKCDRITWRGQYYHLPVSSQSQPLAEPVGEILSTCGYKEASWRKGKLPPIGTKLYAAPQPLVEPTAAVPTRGFAYEAHQKNGLAWAVAQWNNCVKNRPLVNIHRRSFDDTWRQVIRYFGGDPDALVGPSHDALLAASPQHQVKKGELS